MRFIFDYYYYYQQTITIKSSLSAASRSSLYSLWPPRIYKWKKGMSRLRRRKIAGKRCGKGSPQL